MKRIMLALMLFSGVAYAEDEAITLQSGFQYTPNSHYSQGYEVAVRYERPLIWDLNIGAEYAYHGPTYHQDYGDFRGQSILAELIYYPRFTILSKVQPYLLAGAGWSWWDFDRNEKLQSAGIEVQLGDNFADKFAVGFNYPINAQWSFNTEISYFNCFVPKDSYYESDGSYANVVGDDDRHGGRIHVTQEEVCLMFGLKRRF